MPRSPSDLSAAGEDQPGEEGEAVGDEPRLQDPLH